MRRRTAQTLPTALLRQRAQPWSEPARTGLTPASPRRRQAAGARAAGRADRRGAVHGAAALRLRHGLDAACGGHQLRLGCALWVYNQTGLPIALQPAAGRADEQARAARPARGLGPCRRRSLGAHAAAGVG